MLPPSEGNAEESRILGEPFEPVVVRIQRGLEPALGESLSGTIDQRLGSEFLREPLQLTEGGRPLLEINEMYATRRSAKKRSALRVSESFFVPKIWTSKLETRGWWLAVSDWRSARRGDRKMHGEARVRSRYAVGAAAVRAPSSVAITSRSNPSLRMRRS